MILYTSSRVTSWTTSSAMQAPDESAEQVDSAWPRNFDTLFQSIVDRSCVDLPQPQEPSLPVRDPTLPTERRDHVVNVSPVPPHPSGTPPQVRGRTLIVDRQADVASWVQSIETDSFHDGWLPPAPAPSHRTRYEPLTPGAVWPALPARNSRRNYRDRSSETRQESHHREDRGRKANLYHREESSRTRSTSGVHKTIKSYRSTPNMRDRSRYRTTALQDIVGPQVPNVPYVGLPYYHGVPALVTPSQYPASSMVLTQMRYTDHAFGGSQTAAAMEPPFDYGQAQRSYRDPIQMQSSSQEQPVCIKCHQCRCQQKDSMGIMNDPGLFDPSIPDESGDGATGLPEATDTLQNVMRSFDLRLFDETERADDGALTSDVIGLSLLDKDKELGLVVAPDEPASRDENRQVVKTLSDLADPLQALRAQGSTQLGRSTRRTDTGILSPRAMTREREQRSPSRVGRRTRSGLAQKRTQDPSRCEAVRAAADFVNLTSSDSQALLQGVAPSGGSKTRVGRQKTKFGRNSAERRALFETRGGLVQSAGRMERLADI